MRYSPSNRKKSIYVTRKIRQLNEIVIILFAFLFSFTAFADNKIIIEKPIQNSEEKNIDIEFLRDKIRNIDDNLKDSELSNIINNQFVSKQILPRALEACGHTEEFTEFFEGHAFKPHILQETEQNFLKKCMRNVFQLADEQFGFAAPGLYKRFSKKYIDAGLKLGYRCGYRTQEMFTYFSLGIWLVHVEEIESFPAHARFRCLGDLPVNAGYSPQTIQFGVSRFVDALLFYYAVFKNWADVQRYINYKYLVLENRRYDICQYIFMNPHEDEMINKSINSEHECSDYLFHEKQR